MGISTLLLTSSTKYKKNMGRGCCSNSCRSNGTVREWVFEDSRSGRAEDARQQVDQVAVSEAGAAAEEPSAVATGRLGCLPGAAKELGSKFGALGSASDRVQASRATLFLSKSCT